MSGATATLKENFMKGKMKAVPQQTQLYWQCLFCRDLHPWPEERAKKYCSSRCAVAYGRYGGAQLDVFDCCRHCGKMLDRKNKRYCSRSCQSKAYRSRKS